VSRIGEKETFSVHGKVSRNISRNYRPNRTVQNIVSLQYLEPPIGWNVVYVRPRKNLSVFEKYSVSIEKISRKFLESHP
jgi:hypothetical protein